MNLDKARRIAERFHQYQVDKSGKPYIGHLIRVASNVPTGVYQIVAFLHDVVEDTDLELDDLEREGFSKVVIDAVDAMTHRPCETRQEYVLRLLTNPIAAVVKLADIKDNIDKKRIRDWEKACGTSKFLYVDRRKQDHALITTVVLSRGWLPKKHPLLYLED